MVPLMLALMAAGGGPTQIAATQDVSKPARICREAEQVTGSHVRTGRRCLTAEEWQREDTRLTRRPVTMQVTSGQGDGQQAPTRPQ
jgi:hypothetical protein